jgi:ABC-2 type transport system ATP-binding protein
MPSLIKVKGVHKVYGRGTPREKKALKGLSIDIEEGEVFALLGVNGAGKSTLSSILAGLHPPSEGDVEFQGTSIYRDLPGFRQNVGFCPQKPNLDKELTLYENLLYSGLCYGLPKKEVEANLKTLLEAFRLSEYRDFKAFALSGGYRQRFLIARSLVHKPKFIILDEPTVGLDPHVRRELWDHIRVLKDRGVTVVLTTHYLDEAEELADRVCLIDRGKLKLIDTPSNLKSGFKKANLEQVFIEMVKQAENEEGK